ncbi:hypothetical protein [Nostoc sp. ChiVER01]|uniref:hypothetical protein n=1 Tax=Nostoc sp. ChiVER01 TaxID=3075382 RepID=UPI002AD3D8BD|nr:hypothetical protein [Nostoc sp. ChiVER01]MDZ8225103.1 hypothetical protein [Nostoc sp. ChiVER01]
MCANFSQAHTAKAGKAEETGDDLTAAIAVAEAIQQLQPAGVYPRECPALSEQSKFCHHPGCFGAKGILGRLQSGQHG